MTLVQRPRVMARRSLLSAVTPACRAMLGAGARHPAAMPTASPACGMVMKVLAAQPLSTRRGPRRRADVRSSATRSATATAAAQAAATTASGCGRTSRAHCPRRHRRRRVLVQTPTGSGPIMAAAAQGSRSAESRGQPRIVAIALPVTRTKACPAIREFGCAGRLAPPRRHLPSCRHLRHHLPSRRHLLRPHLRRRLHAPLSASQPMDSHWGLPWRMPKRPLAYPSTSI